MTELIQYLVRERETHNRGSRALQLQHLKMTGVEPKCLTTIIKDVSKPKIETNQCFEWLNQLTQVMSLFECVNTHRLFPFL